MAAKVERKLAAILAADVVGYSRLIGADETGTLARLKALRQELIDPTIAEHRGRIIKLMGDGALVEFASVVDAVECAVAIQRGMAERNEGARQDQRIDFRIGINLGDVVVEDEDVFGDGVNVAARLEALAQPGGICIARSARDQVRDKLDLVLDDLGEVEVKNIARPIRVFRVQTDPNAVAAPSRDGIMKVPAQRMVLVATAAALLLGLAGFAVWQRPWAPGAVLQSSPLAASSSIAVLPFENLSEGSDQEYFSDGVTEDIITDLSKFHDLFVVASNSTFAYKNRPVSIGQVGRELGVRYVLEGSMQRNDQRVRINVQLIDAAGGQHLWAERYDESVDDIFELQDRITKRIVQSLAVRLTDIELDRVSAKPTKNLEAYDYVLKGRALAADLTRGDNSEARAMFRQAIELDPAYAPAYSGLGFTYFHGVLYGWSVLPNRDLDRAFKLAQKSLDLDQSDVVAHRLLGRIYLFRKEYDLGVVELERALALNPNDAASYADQGLNLVWSSRPEGAILAFETALRLDPNMGSEGLFHLGLAYYLTGRYQDAILHLERSSGRNPDFVLTYVPLAAAYGQIENHAKASRAAAAIRRLDPFFSADEFGQLFRNPADAAQVTAGLRKAGLN
jgi:TolB-like protein/class 3 adenylate cyclase/Flp pilus assembly protein TadD